MKKKTCSFVLGVAFLTAIFPSCTASRKADLPRDPFPLGAADLVEVRSVQAIRPGITHLHVERGTWGPDGPPQSPYTMRTEPTQDRASLAPIRKCLEQAGYAVQERSVAHASDPVPYYQLTAGEFKDEYWTRRALEELTCAEKLDAAPLALEPTWDRGPYSLHVAIIDPKKYRGKIVSEWSRRAWRASPMELALKHNASVAVNSVFFEYSENGIAGIPSGLSIVQGEWRREGRMPSWDALVFIENTEDGIEIALGTPLDAPPMPEFSWGDGKIAKIDGINRMPSRHNEFVAMKMSVWATSRFSRQPPSEALGYDVVCAQIKSDGTLSYGVVDERDPTDGDSFLTADATDIVLMATGRKRAILHEAMKSGAPVHIDLKVAGRPGLNVFETHDILVRDGVPVPLWGYDAPLPRWAHSSIGWDAEGKIYLFSSLHGTPANPRVAVSPSEITEVALFLGLTNLVGLTGDVNAASMVIEGRDVEAPELSLFEEDRRVAEVILVVDK